MIGKLLRRLLLPPDPVPDSGDMKYARAVTLSDEVTEKILQRAHAHPFRTILGELLLRDPPDRALIADAFEAHQEARIFRGPPNGHG